MHPQRSWSEQPSRPKATSQVSMDLKFARANGAAKALWQPDIEQTGNVLERQEIQMQYAWGCIRSVDP